MSKNIAKNTLCHYIEKLFTANGMHWDGDNNLEVSEIVEQTIQAAKEEIMREVKEEISKQIYETVSQSAWS